MQTQSKHRQKSSQRISSGGYIARNWGIDIESDVLEVLCEAVSEEMSRWPVYKEVQREPEMPEMTFLEIQVKGFCEESDAKDVGEAETGENICCVVG